MSELTIRKENRPTRCEICHQSDLFNSDTGKCERCENLSLPIEKIALPTHYQTVVQNALDFTAVGSAFLGLLAFVPGLFLPPLGVFLGIMAWVSGFRALKRIRARQRAITGESFAYIGVYCGALGAILGFLLFLFILQRT